MQLEGGFPSSISILFPSDGSRKSQNEFHNLFIFWVTVSILPHVMTFLTEHATEYKTSLGLHLIFQCKGSLNMAMVLQAAG